MANEAKARDLTTLRNSCHNAARNKGFYDGVYTTQDEGHHINQQLVHLMIEVGELADTFRKTGSLDAPEAADIIIVLLDLCGFMDIDIEGAVDAKMARNATRPARYGVK